MLLPLYAEIHYRGKYLPSYLFRPFPEIISDIPVRLEPGQKLPVLLLLKDADLFPVRLLSVKAQVTCSDGSLTEYKLFSGSELISSNFHHRIFYLDFKKTPPGIYHIDLLIKVSKVSQGCKSSGTYTFLNHAYKGVPVNPHILNYSGEKYPRPESVYYGDMHVHSSYTRDQVEFGAPLQAVQTMADASGLDFACITDHSYDMDDSAANPLIQDPELKKWAEFQEEIKSLNNGISPVLIPGLEISCGNRRGRNVHMLLLNDPVFYHGSGDGAERWFRTKPENQLSEILQNKSIGSIAYAAHPFVSISFLQKLLIRRGEWSLTDVSNPGLSGIQILNGEFDGGFCKGLKVWKQLLLTGRRPAIAAGNDSHGNFNLFRQVKIALLKLHEKEFQIFGKMRTGIYLQNKYPKNKYLKNKPDIPSILSALKTGRSFITSGPALKVSSRENGEIHFPGDTINQKSFCLDITAESSSEFGELDSIKIYSGCINSGKELCYKEIRFRKSSFNFSGRIEYEHSSTSGYVRFELYTGNGNLKNQCYTNPLFISC